MKRDIAQEITDNIITALEAGVAPWVKPWSGSAETGGPSNPVSGTQYRGINFIVLSMLSNGYSTDRWITYKQAEKAGGKVAKGSKGTGVVFWKFLDKKGDDGEPTGERIPLLKHYTVFNLDQCEGVDHLYPEPVEITEAVKVERIAAAEALLSAVPAKVGHGGDSAYFSPAEDRIQLPNIEDFNTVEDYYSTSFHEHGHWTGHSSRLDRLTGDKFGGEGYAFEELVAELTAAMLCKATGIDGKLQHAEYIGHWLKVLKDDKRAVLRAASMAQKAVDHLEAYGQPEEQQAAA